MNSSTCEICESTFTFDELEYALLVTGEQLTACGDCFDDLDDGLVDWSAPMDEVAASL